MRVEVQVSGYSFNFPDRCCCCGTTTQPSLGAIGHRGAARIARIDARGWQIPICPTCVDHHAACKRVNVKAFFAGFIVSSPIFAFLDTEFIPVIFPILGLIAGFLVLRSGQAKVRQRCRPTCVTLEAAAAFITSYGTINVFTFKSPTYARDFALLNHSKLVNINRELRMVLASNSQSSARVP